MRNIAQYNASHFYSLALLTVDLSVIGLLISGRGGVTTPITGDFGSETVTLNADGSFIPIISTSVSDNSNLSGNGELIIFYFYKS